MAKEWFSTWFDSMYYHRLYKDRNHDEAERFIHNLVEFLEIPSGSKILDLACGKGRHSKILHSLGNEVVGLDLSPNSIREAQNFSTKDLRFEVHDMREVYHQLDFDYVFNLFTSFGYFDDEQDNRKALEGMKAVIKEQGKIVIDFLNAPWVENNLVPNQIKEVQGTEFKIQRSKKDNCFQKQISFGSDEGQEYQFTEKVQALTLVDFKKMFDTLQLSIIGTFGSYELTPYNEQESDRLIIVASK